MYKTIQISSEIKSIDKKFFGLKTRDIINNQTIIDQKVNQTNI